MAAWRIERPECEPPPTFTTVGIAVNDVHALVRNVKQIGDHLGEARLVALPVRLRADHGIDAGRPGRILRPHLERACSFGAPIEDST